MGEAAADWSRFSNAMAAVATEFAALKQSVQQDPVLLLQPIIENAVVHGMDAGQERLNVDITARLASDALELVVENDGPVESKGNGSGRGVGLSTTRARLATAYGERASLTMEPRDTGGMRVRIRVPNA